MKIKLFSVAFALVAGTLAPAAGLVQADENQAYSAPEIAEALEELYLSGYHCHLPLSSVEFFERTEDANDTFQECMQEVAGANVARSALSQQGVKYVYATSKPGVSFDCSGLVAWAWSDYVDLPHQSHAIASSGKVTVIDSPEDAMPGDVLYRSSGHVSIYTGNGQAVHAPNSRSVVKTFEVNWNKEDRIVRPNI